MPIERSAMVRAYLAGPRTPPPPRDAATVVLLRDGADGLETFLLHRPGRMAFAAGMYVYPGGSVDPSDADGGYPWGGPPLDRWARVLGGDETSARCLLAAAVRETFEESGVLLAGERGSVPSEQVRARREAVRAGTTSLAAVLAEHRLPLRSDALVPWARWVTPEFSSRRFDTWFFVAAMPPGQIAAADGAESDTGRWMTVRAALAAYRADELPMFMVTAAALRDLAPYRSVREVTQLARDVTPLMLRAVEEADGFRYVIDVDGVPVDEADFIADGFAGTPPTTEQRSTE